MIINPIIYQNDESSSLESISWIGQSGAYVKSLSQSELSCYLPFSDIIMIPSVTKGFIDLSQEGKVQLDIDVKDIATTINLTSDQIVTGNTVLGVEGTGAKPSGEWLQPYLIKVFEFGETASFSDTISSIFTPETGIIYWGEWIIYSSLNNENWVINSISNFEGSGNSFTITNLFENSTFNMDGESNSSVDISFNYTSEISQYYKGIFYLYSSKGTISVPEDLIGKAY